MSGSSSPISGSVYRPKRDDDVGRFGVVKLQVGRIGVAPAGKIHDLSRLSPRPSRLGRLHDIEPVAVEEESVFPEQIVQLWNHWMVVGNGLGFELAQRSLDLCGSEFDRRVLSMGSPQGAKPRARVLRGPPTSRGQTLCSVLPRSLT